LSTKDPLSVSLSVKQRSASTDDVIADPHQPTGSTFALFVHGLPLVP
jgi:hypothetical protein